MMYQPILLATVGSQRLQGRLGNGYEALQARTVGTTLATTQHLTVSENTP